MRPVRCPPFLPSSAMEQPGGWEGGRLGKASGDGTHSSPRPAWRLWEEMPVGTATPVLEP